MRLNIHSRNYYNKINLVINTIDAVQFSRNINASEIINFSKRNDGATNQSPQIEQTSSFKVLLVLSTEQRDEAEKLSSQKYTRNGQLIFTDESC